MLQVVSHEMNPEGFPVGSIHRVEQQQVSDGMPEGQVAAIESKVAGVLKQFRNMCVSMQESIQEGMSDQIQHAARYVLFKLEDSQALSKTQSGPLEVCCQPVR